MSTFLPVLNQRIDQTGNGGKRCQHVLVLEDDALANLGYDRAGHFREIILQALALVEVSKEMKPKEIIRRQASLKAKPGSAFSVLTPACTKGSCSLLYTDG